MAAKVFIVLCAQAILIQCALSQCNGRGPALGPATPFGFGYDGLPHGAGCGGGTASSGGGFIVNSVSPIAPTGISIISKNTIEGSLAATGQVPFLAAVGVEGILPTAGVGTISYGCGNGNIAMISEGPSATGIVGLVSPARPNAGYGPGLPAGGPLYGPGHPAGGPLHGPGLAVAGPLNGFCLGAGVAPGFGYNGLAGCGCGAQ